MKGRKCKRKRIKVRAYKRHIQFCCATESQEATENIAISIYLMCVYVSA